MHLLGARAHRQMANRCNCTYCLNSLSALFFFPLSYLSGLPREREARPFRFQRAPANRQRRRRERGNNGRRWTLTRCHTQVQEDRTKTQAKSDFVLLKKKSCYKLLHAHDEHLVAIYATTFFLCVLICKVSIKFIISSIVSIIIIIITPSHND